MLLSQYGATILLRSNDTFSEISRMRNPSTWDSGEKGRSLIRIGTYYAIHGFYGVQSFVGNLGCWCKALMKRSPKALALQFHLRIRLCVGNSAFAIQTDENAHFTPTRVVKLPSGKSTPFTHRDTHFTSPIPFVPSTRPLLPTQALLRRCSQSD